MSDVRADELVKGDVLLIRGDRWTVMKAKVKGKHVRLVIDGRKGTFDQTVKGRSVYARVERAGRVDDSSQSDSGRGNQRPRVSGSLLSAAGAQTGWAEPEEVSGTSWGVPASKGEARLVDRLGARLVSVEVEGGRLVVPPVDDSTIFGHLLTMHQVTFSGVTFAEAKAWVKEHDPATEQSATQVVDALSIQRAFELHDTLHVDLTSMERPHWHQERAPR